MKTCSREKKNSRLLSLVAVLALGLLIWTRLRLVSPLPRTVYADPGELAGGTSENGAAVQEGAPKSAHADGSVNEPVEAGAAR